MVRASVIIAYYKNLPYLRLVLEGLARQSVMAFEVIIAEDDNNDETTSFLTANQYRFPIIHLHQTKDKGFRKNEMLNKAIVKAKAETLIFIDGDCIPHRHLVKNYLRQISDTVLLYGRRVMLSRRLTERMLATNRLLSLNLIQLLWYGCSMIQEAVYSPYITLKNKQRHLCGCNWGVQKQQLLDINGFDEDYTHQGVGEDVDVEWRLVKNGLHLKSIRNRAIVYHLYHQRTYQETGVQENYCKLTEKQRQGRIVCANGIAKTAKDVK